MTRKRPGSHDDSGVAQGDVDQSDDLAQRGSHSSDDHDLVRPPQAPPTGPGSRKPYVPSRPPLVGQQVPPRRPASPAPSPDPSLGLDELSPPNAPPQPIIGPDNKIHFPDTTYDFTAESLSKKSTDLLFPDTVINPRLSARQLANSKDQRDADTDALFASLRPARLERSTPAPANLHPADDAPTNTSAPAAAGAPASLAANALPPGNEPSDVGGGFADDQTIDVSHARRDVLEQMDLEEEATIPPPPPLAPLSSTPLPSLSPLAALQADPSESSGSRDALDERAQTPPTLRALTPAPGTPVPLEIPRLTGTGQARLATIELALQNRQVISQYHSRKKKAPLHLTAEGALTRTPQQSPGEDEQEERSVCPKFIQDQLVSLSVPIGLAHDPGGTLCESHLTLRQAVDGGPMWMRSLVSLQASANKTIQFKNQQPAAPYELDALNVQQRMQLNFLLTPDHSPITYDPLFLLCEIKHNAEKHRKLLRLGAKGLGTRWVFDADELSVRPRDAQDAELQPFEGELQFQLRDDAFLFVSLDPIPHSGDTDSGFFVDDRGTLAARSSQGTQKGHADEIDLAWFQAHHLHAYLVAILFPDKMEALIEEAMGLPTLPAPPPPTPTPPEPLDVPIEEDPFLSTLATSASPSLPPTRHKLRLRRKRPTSPSSSALPSLLESISPASPRPEATRFDEFEVLQESDALAPAAADSAPSLESLSAPTSSAALGARMLPEDGEDTFLGAAKEPTPPPDAIQAADEGEIVNDLKDSSQTPPSLDPPPPPADTGSPSSASQESLAIDIMEEVEIIEEVEEVEEISLDGIEAAGGLDIVDDIEVRDEEQRLSDAAHQFFDELTTESSREHDLPLLVPPEEEETSDHLQDLPSGASTDSPYHIKDNDDASDAIDVMDIDDSDILEEVESDEYDSVSINTLGSREEHEAETAPRDLKAGLSEHQRHDLAHKRPPTQAPRSVPLPPSLAALDGAAPLPMAPGDEDDTSRSSFGAEATFDARPPHAPTPPDPMPGVSPLSHGGLYASADASQELPMAGGSSSSLGASGVPVKPEDPRAPLLDPPTMVMPQSAMPDPAMLASLSPAPEQRESLAPLPPMRDENTIPSISMHHMQQYAPVFDAAPQQPGRLGPDDTFDQRRARPTNQPRPSLISSHRPPPEETAMRRIELEPTPLNPDTLGLHIQISQGLVGQASPSDEVTLSIHASNRTAKFPPLGITVHFSYSETDRGKVFPRVVIQRSANIRGVPFADHPMEIFANRNENAHKGFNHIQELPRGHMAKIDLSAQDQARGILLLTIQQIDSIALVGSMRMTWYLND